MLALLEQHDACNRPSVLDFLQLTSLEMSDWDGPGLKPNQGLINDTNRQLPKHRTMRCLENPLETNTKGSLPRLMVGPPEYYLSMGLSTMPIATVGWPAPSV